MEKFTNLIFTFFYSFINILSKKSIRFLLLMFILFFSLNIKFCKAQWIYQSLPSYHDVQDIKFFDENTGILIMYYNDPGMFRTTNGGNNWVMINNYISFYNMKKIDSTALYLVGRYNGIDRIQRTFDRGLTWDSVSLTGLSGGYTGLSFINRDTGWVTGANYLNYNCIWKTTNGGVTLTELTDTTGMGIIFFLKNKINGQYYGWLFGKYGDNKFWRTTNSGTNWFQITKPNSQYLNFFEFLDDSTGWFTGQSGIFKSTNGGLNWILQILPSGNGIYNTITNFKIINNDTIYGSGGYKDLGARVVGLIWKTTNSGINWGYQQPDTSYYNGYYRAIDFINGLTGWAFGGNGIHTTNGGGPIIYTKIKINNYLISNDYKLFQNYPNPFNSITNIKVQMPKQGFAEIKVYNITGKTEIILVNQKLSSGEHVFKFNGDNLSSGVYFYSFFIDEIRMDTKKLVLLK
jgi:photosystem II stability/assembly factor-like uncharacterized protein